MSTKEQLIKKYSDQNNYLSKKELGQLRRYILTELLESILSNNGLCANDWIDKHKTKLVKSKLATAMGYKTTSDNIRQSFKVIVEDCENKLRDMGVITGESKTNIQKSNENLAAFTLFLQERLADIAYEWPKNIKGFLYRKAIWAYFLDIPPDEVKYMPSFFTSNEDLGELLAGIDTSIYKEQVKTLPYDNASALDEMSDVMLNRALSAMRKKLKEKTTEVLMLREELRELKEDLDQQEQSKEFILKGDINAFKRGSVH